MVNPVDIGLRIAQALDSIGIKMGSYIGKGSNIKKAMFGGKPTMFKPNALEALRGTGGNFDDALKLIENESQFIVNATDAEKMAFLNNVNDYKEFGGPLKKDLVARTEFEQGLGSLKGDIEDLQSSTSDLLTTAKSMKDDAEKGLKSAEDDLKVFFETGGNPLKKEDKKFLGGSMHEEGQIRTGIRQFLQNELKNGRIKLDSMDTERVMKYFPTIEDDPILVFKKIYGDEAYNKAGSFPGAFEIGEDFNHYRTIFESKMGEDILKVKDKKYVGDGTLTLTDEVRTPTPDDDVPFAEGGIADIRPGFVKGTKVGKRIVEEIVEYITSKFTPMDAMKEVNKVIGKTGKYKNLKLTQKDIDEIVEGSNDFIFQRDPDNQFVEGSIKDRTEYLDDADKAGTFFPKTSKDKSIDKKIKRYDEEGEAQFNKDVEEAGGMEAFLEANPIGNTVDDMSIEESLTTLEGLGGTKMAERFKLKQKYPGLDDDLLTSIIEDTDPMHKASVLAKIDMAMELGKTNKSADEIIEILKSEPETKMATGGRAGFDKGGSVIKLLDGTTVQIPAGSYGKYGLKDYIYSSSKGDLTKDEIVPLLVPSGASYATGGRAGFYMGGQSGQSVIEPDLSDIGHGSDALMSRTRLSAPGSQATTSTGLNYLLGEDNDNTRIPFKDGLGVEVPPSKPYTPDMFEKDSMTLLQGMYGTGKDSNKFLYNEMIKKGNILRNQGVEKETVIEIIRNNKDKINAFLETQTTTPKSLKGLADGGPARKGFRGGGSDASTTSFSQSFDNQHGTNTAANANTSVDRQQAQGQAQADATNARIANTDLGREQALNNYIAVNYPNQNPNNKTLGQKIGYGVGSFFNNPFVRTYATIGSGGFSEKLRQMMIAKKAYDNKNIFQDEIIEDEIRNIPITGGITSNYADGGITGLRQGYVGGGGVNLARRGFLKVLGATAAGVAAFKTGALKLLGKTATTKGAPKLFTAAEGSGAPAWFEGMVNKVLADGVDITKKAATMDGQTVKSLNTPTGKVDVTIDRTGNIDVNYMGDNTAMGEGVDMRYVVGQADETTKVKPFDEFEAVETIPEGRMTGPDDYNVEFGENATGEVKNLFSDVSELQTLGGDKRLINDISVTLQKKKTLKQMNENPTEFANDNLPDVDFIPTKYDYE